MLVDAEADIAGDSALFACLEDLYIQLLLHFRLTSTPNQTSPTSRNTQFSILQLRGSYSEVQCRSYSILTSTTLQHQPSSSILHTQNISSVHLERLASACIEDAVIAHQLWEA